ncbi:Os08g0391501 [Oryza sativa Japonica Group]|uniref:Os08g0391501 protein n=1 Tax=Oryza sativa subsp. japonica TaxID=39947 RepID=A0A0P0XFZ1_ORYSJ|nr:Os08g0391501 [Oryza sativa Japonica Group]
MRCSLKPPVTYGASSRPHRIAHPHRLLVLIVNRGNLIQVVARRGPSSTSSNKPASFRRWSLSAAVAAGCTTVAVALCC